MVVTVKTVNTLLSEDNGLDALGLYFFYYKTAKKQQTNQVRATEAFCRKGLNIGVKRFRAAQTILKKYNLVELLKSGSHWYIKINYVKTNSVKNDLVESEVNSAKKQLVSFQPTEMLKVNKYINALSKESNPLTPLNKYSSLEDLTQLDFQEIAEHYHVPLAFVLSEYENMCLWAGERPGNPKLKGRNWRLTLMAWVKRDGLKIIERSKGDPTKRSIDARNL